MKNNNIKDNLSWEFVEASVFLGEGKRYHRVRATFPKENNVGLLEEYTKFGTQCKEINFIERDYLCREFWVDVETREIFAAPLDNRGFEERKLKDNEPLSKICVEAPNYYGMAHYDKIGHYMFNTQ